MQNTIDVSATKEELGFKVAEYCSILFKENTNPFFHIAVSGGNTPQYIFNALCA
jgi:6-phosphogluconolactonase/glucosamine-6-phosphate isomerase/deaminase